MTSILNGEIVKIQVEGLGITYLYKSIGISFCIDSFWEQIRHRYM